MKRAQGTYRADRAPKNEPMPTLGLPQRPVWLDKDPDAAAEYDRIVPELESLGLVTKIDGGALEGYLSSYSRAVKADRIIRTRGLVVKTPFGPKANPAVAIAKQAWVEVRNFGARFGLNPADRSRVNTPEKPIKRKPDDPAEFMFGGLKIAK
jgi:P27 family predicted phage terminase small subunit